MSDNGCTCPMDDDEDTSSLEEDFIPANVQIPVGHRMTSQESAMIAFRTLGLKPKNEEEEENG